VQNWQRLEQGIRCHACNKFFTKIILDVYIPDWLLTKTRELGIVIQEKDNGNAFLSSTGIEVKVATETVCHRCKAEDHQLIAV
jgi:hypothetical protein